MRSAKAQESHGQERKDQWDDRMQWWREARFGLFIHWGIYSVPAGVYKGTPIDGDGEWIMLYAQIPVGEYRDDARQFNPVKYDPETWVKLSREAGMKYIVITAHGQTSRWFRSFRFRSIQLERDKGYTVREGSAETAGRHVP